MTPSWMTKVVVAVIVSVAALAAEFAYADVSVGTQEPAIEGYSPVSYFTVGMAERGRPEFAVTHDGSTYFLTSAEQVTLFESNPDHFAPVYGAYCPYNLALGRTAKIDPTNFRIFNDQLLLFHRSEEMDAAAAFDATDGRQDLLRRANREFRLFRF